MWMRSCGAMTVAAVVVVGALVSCGPPSVGTPLPAPAFDLSASHRTFSVQATGYYSVHLTMESPDQRCAVSVEFRNLDNAHASINRYSYPAPATPGVRQGAFSADFDTAGTWEADVESGGCPWSMHIAYSSPDSPQAGGS